MISVENINVKMLSEMTTMKDILIGGWVILHTVYPYIHFLKCLSVYLTTQDTGGTPGYTQSITGLIKKQPSTLTSASIVNIESLINQTCLDCGNKAEHQKNTSNI